MWLYTIGAMHLGKDILGSVRESNEYDAFGKPYQGDLKNGMNLGYTGKPYDPTTGLYNYGYRDYQPEAARFTTVDPVRDGANWFAYVNNDPVNYVDLWGLECIGARDKGNLYANTSTFATLVPVDSFGKNGQHTGFALGFFETTITTTVVVDEETNSANIFSVSSKSAYETYDVKSTTSASVNVNGFEYDSKTLTHSPSLTRGDQVSLGSAQVNIPAINSNNNIVITTSTSYIIDTGSGFWVVGTQTVEAPIND
jgi:RHS repeat-associated protein